MTSFLHHTRKILHHTKKTWENIHKTLFRKKPTSRDIIEEEKIILPRKEKTQKVSVDISVTSATKASLAIIGILALVYFMYIIQGTLVLVFVSLILAAAIDPLVDYWQKRKIPRGVSVIILYIIFLFLLGATVYSFIPIIAEQIVTLTKNVGKVVNNILTAQDLEFPFSRELKPLYESFVSNIDKQQIITQLQQALSSISVQLANIAGNSLAALGAIFNGIFNALLVLVLTFFMVTDKKAINHFFFSIIPSRYAPYFAIKTKQMQKKIGGWVRGQVLLCLSVGIATYIGLWILQLFGIDIQYKETLSVIAAVTEIIPYIGPAIGAIPAVLIATNVSLWAVLWIIILYIVIQTLENNVVVPVVMNKEVGLNPIIILIAMLIGAQFFGIIGIVLSIPVATSISVLVQDYITKEK